MNQRNMIRSNFGALAQHPVKALSLGRGNCQNNTPRLTGGYFGDFFYLDKDIIFFDATDNAVGGMPQAVKQFYCLTRLAAQDVLQNDAPRRQKALPGPAAIMDGKNGVFP